MQTSIVPSGSLVNVALAVEPSVGTVNVAVPLALPALSPAGMMATLLIAVSGKAFSVAVTTEPAGAP